MVEADPRHESGALIERVIGRSPDVGAIGRVGIDPNPVPVLDTEGAGVDRVHVKLGVADTRHPVLGPMGVTEVRVPDPVPVGDGPRRMDGMS